MTFSFHSNSNRNTTKMSATCTGINFSLPLHRRQSRNFQATILSITCPSLSSLRSWTKNLYRSGSKLNVIATTVTLVRFRSTSSAGSILPNGGRRVKVVGTLMIQTRRCVLFRMRSRKRRPTTEKTTRFLNPVGRVAKNIFLIFRLRHRCLILRCVLNRISEKFTFIN